MSIYCWDRTLAYAPRWGGPGDPPPAEADNYVDDELGLSIAEDIRNGRYRCIDSEAPIVFFTARENERVRERVRGIRRSVWIGKPAFLDDLLRVMEQLTCPDAKAGREDEVRD